MSRLIDVKVVRLLLGQGSPEGVRGDPPTTLYLDGDEGRLYSKRTRQGVNTGWVAYATGGGVGVTVGVVDPEGVVVADQGTLYYNSTNGTMWFKASGSGNTGWE